MDKQLVTFDCRVGVCNVRLQGRGRFILMLGYELSLLFKTCDPTRLKLKTAMKYFNLCLSIKLNSLSRSITSINYHFLLSENFDDINTTCITLWQIALKRSSIIDRKIVQLTLLWFRQLSWFPFICIHRKGDVAIIRQSDSPTVR